MGAPGTATRAVRWPRGWITCPHRDDFSSGDAESDSDAAKWRFSELDVGSGHVDERPFGDELSDHYGISVSVARRALVIFDPAARRRSTDFLTVPDIAETGRGTLSPGEVLLTAGMASLFANAENNSDTDSDISIAD